MSDTSQFDSIASSQDEGDFTFHINQQIELQEPRYSSESLKQLQAVQIRAHLMTYLQNRQKQIRLQSQQQQQQQEIAKQQRQPQRLQEYFDNQSQYSKKQYEEFTQYLQKQQEQEERKQREYQQIAEQQRVSRQSQIQLSDHDNRVEILQYTQSLPENFRQVKKTVLFKKIMDGARSNDSSQGDPQDTTRAQSGYRAKSTISESLTLRGIENSYYQDSDEEDDDIFLDADEQPPQQINSKFYNVGLQECSMLAGQQQLNTKNLKTLRKPTSSPSQQPNCPQAPTNCPQHKRSGVQDCFLNDEVLKIYKQESGIMYSDQSTDSRCGKVRSSQGFRNNRLKSRSRLSSIQQYIKQYVTKFGEEEELKSDGSIPFFKDGKQTKDQKQINSIVEAFERISKNNKAWGTNIGQVRVEKQIIEHGLELNEIKYTLILQENIQDNGNKQSWFNEFRLENMNSAVLNSNQFDRILA